MRVIAEYTQPRWNRYRKLVGINTYAHRSSPDGFETKMIYRSSLQEIESHIKYLTYKATHQDPGRPMKMSDLLIRIED